MSDKADFYEFPNGSKIFIQRVDEERRIRSSQTDALVSFYIQTEPSETHWLAEGASRNSPRTRSQSR